MNVDGDIVLVGGFRGIFTGGDPPYAPVDLDPGCEVDERVSDPPYYLSKRFITKLTCPEPTADITADGAVDLRDVAGWQTCFTGDGMTTCGDGCGVLDLDFDDDIDLTDYAMMLQDLQAP